MASVGGFALGLLAIFGAGLKHPRVVDPRPIPTSIRTCQDWAPVYVLRVSASCKPDRLCPHGQRVVVSDLPTSLEARR